MSTRHDFHINWVPKGPKREKRSQTTARESTIKCHFNFPQEDPKIKNCDFHGLPSPGGTRKVGSSCDADEGRLILNGQSHISFNLRLQSGLKNTQIFLVNYHFYEDFSEKIEYNWARKTRPALSVRCVATGQNLLTQSDLLQSIQ